MNIKGIIAILWLLIGMGVWTYTEYKSATEGTLVEFEVGGYDPRDLLAGHYVIYRVNYGNEPICGVGADESKFAYSQNRCICLKVDPLDRLAVVSSVEPCDRSNKPSCPLWIKGTCDYSGRFEAGIERFYIPEAYSQFLLTVPAETRVVVNVTSKGRALVKDLKIAGEDLETYIAKKRTSPE